MLTAVSRHQNRDALIPILMRSGMKDISSLDWGNKMLVIHFMQKALEILKDPPDQIRYAVMLHLAYCYEDRGFSHEAAYWYQKCLRDCGFFGQRLTRLHVQGHLLVNLIDAHSLPDAEQLLGEIQPAGCEGDDPAYTEHMQALTLYFEAMSQRLDDDGSEKVKSPADALLALCGKHREYLLIQKLRYGALRLLAQRSQRTGDYDCAISLFQQAAAAAIAFGQAQKAADCRKAVSAIYESLGDLRQAFAQYQKYYRMSARICRRKGGEFSDYLYAINHSGETDQELSSLREMKQYLSLKRNTDPLTGVYNRRFWDEALEQKAAASGPDTVFSVFMLDIDSFKAYNDTFGHLTGDRTLKAIGSVLKGCLRAKADILARFGGDEFMILVEGMDERESRRLAGRILAGIRDNTSYGGVPAPTLSIGIATGKIGWDCSFSRLLEEVDAALYYAKSHGRDTSVHIMDIKGMGEDDRQA